MEGRLIVIAVDGSRTVVMLDEPPSEDILEAAVGGSVEGVPLFDTYEGKPCTAFRDEEGKVTGKPLNPVATDLWHSCTRYHARDVLVGPVAIVQGDAELMMLL